MSIKIDRQNKVFMLQAKTSTYVIRLYADSYLLHGGWFHSLDSWSNACTAPLVDRPFSPVPPELHGKADFSMDSQQCEFPCSGSGDFRIPAIEILDENGVSSLNLIYDNYKIYKGKKSLAGLPSTYVHTENEVDTLEIYLKDSRLNVTVTLVYTVWKNYDAICRHTVIQNNGNNIRIAKVMSASVDFMGSRYKMLQLSGAHARERHAVIRDLFPGLQGIESRRCMSSHQQNPFIALMAHNASEDFGEVFGFSLVYNGNFTAQVEVDQFNTSRVQMGINPDNFVWNLKNGESFTSPEVVMVRSENGLGEMSRTYHDLYRNNICRGEWQYKERPVVINNWEATYFNFTVEKILSLADTAAKEGIELFVLDDGWFGKRNDDKCALGDWFVNREKLPNGLEEIADGVHKCGMKFGLWFEPEMISENSDLYRAHPDWCLAVKGKRPLFGRNQFVLDLSREEIVDFLIERISRILSSVEIDYVKWDFNRSPTDVVSQAVDSEDSLETSHRFYLGLYRLLETITQNFPHVLFESCSGGGGRFDPAMLYYMPQAWTSDNTDAISRIAIQLGTSIVYPASAMSCHVSAVPNHQCGRITTLSQRAHAAMAGTFGYELDLNKLTGIELEEIKAQVEWYKKIRNTVQFGDLYRIESPWDYKSQSESGRYAAWQIASKDKSQHIVTVVWTYPEANAEFAIIKLRNLLPDGRYRITAYESAVMKEILETAIFEASGTETTGITNGTIAYGSELMYAGLHLMCRPAYGGSVQYILEKV